jgi:hypothetical protein
MSPTRSLPRHRSHAWLGGFAIDDPVYTTSISASGGTVVAATECIYRIRPGTTHFQWRDLPDGHGDIECVAVEPRRPGSPARFAYAVYPNTLYLVDDGGVVPIDVPLDGEAIHGLMWARRANGGDSTMLLHLWLGDRVLRLLPDDGGPNHQFEEKFWPTDSGESDEANVRAMASDGDRGVAFAVFDEENWDLDVWVLEDLESNVWIRRSIEAPSLFLGARLAVAGTAVAVAFEKEEGVYVARRPREPLVRMDALRGDDGVLAFGGASADAPLFAAVQETPHRSVIARIDAEGRHERIAELTVESDEAPEVRLIHEMVWDDTRRTLWCAAGQGGVMCSTEPGAPTPLGEMGAQRAPS